MSAHTVMLRLQQCSWWSKLQQFVLESFRPENHEVAEAGAGLLLQ